MRQTRDYFIPHKARHHNRKDHWQFFVLGLVSIYEGLIMVLSLGFASVDAREWFLFEWLDDDEKET